MLLKLVQVRSELVVSRAFARYSLSDGCAVGLHRLFCVAVLVFVPVRYKARSNDHMQV